MMHSLFFFCKVFRPHVDQKQKKEKKLFGKLIHYERCFYFSLNKRVIIIYYLRMLSFFLRFCCFCFNDDDDDYIKTSTLSSDKCNDSSSSLLSRNNSEIYVHFGLSNQWKEKKHLLISLSLSLFW